MKIRAIIPNEPKHASNWWRIVRPFAMLQERGHDATYHPYTELDNIDFDGAIVIIHRIIPSTPKKYVLDFYTKGAKSVVYSMDDYTIEPEALREYLEGCGGLMHAAIDRMVDQIPKQLQTIEQCSAVLVSSLSLAELVFDQVHKNVIVLSNAIDEDWFIERLSTQPDHIGNSSTVYIGWAGGRRPESDLVHMARAWESISNDFPQVRFVVAGWQPDILDRHIPLDRKIRIPWQSFDDWPKSMQVDIGCCPLDDTKFNQGKSPIKFYEYTLGGAAVVASPTVYESQIVSKINGYIATNEHEWYDYLSKLIISKPIRDNMQKAAYYNIHEFTSLNATIKNWEFHLGQLE